DSLIESRRAADGEMLGTRGLLEIVRTIDAASPPAFIASLLGEIARGSATGLDDADDVTVLLFRPHGQSPRVSLKNKVSAPFRVARGILQSIRSGERLPLPELSIANIGGAMLDPLGKLWRGVRK